MKRRSLFALAGAALAALCTPVLAAASRRPAPPAEELTYAELPLFAWVPEDFSGQFVVPGDYGPGTSIATGMPMKFGERWYMCHAVERMSTPRSSWVKFRPDPATWWDADPREMS